MRSKLSDTLSKNIYALLALGFLWALIKMFSKSYYGYDPLLLGGAAAGSFALIILFWFAAKKHEAFLQKHSRIITACFLILMLSVQLCASFPLRYTTAYDIDALFSGASEWVNTGNFESYHEYFAMFHNNFGGLFLFRIWFGIARVFGVQDFFVPACILNSLLSIAAMYLTGSSAAKLFGAHGRMTAYFLFLISLPFYFIAPAFYTDALTMVFPALIFRLWLAAREQKRLDKKLACGVLMGLACGIGYGIKATVIIMLIAVVIEGILFTDIKTWLPLAAIAAALTVGVTLAVNSIIYGYIGRAKAEYKQVPITHWIMMGLSGWGGYSSRDYEFTKSFNDPAERAEAINKRISERIKKLGAGGLFEHFDGKIDLVWNDGTYGLSDCLGCPHEEDNYLHDFLVNNESEARYEYKHITTGVLAALYLLIIVSCVSDLIGKGKTVGLLAPRLALFGLFIFFLFWEARWRYFSNFVPIIMLCAITGIESVMANFNSRRKNTVKREKPKH